MRGRTSVFPIGASVRACAIAGAGAPPRSSGPFVKWPAAARRPAPWPCATRWSADSSWRAVASRSERPWVQSSKSSVAQMSLEGSDAMHALGTVGHRASRALRTPSTTGHRAPQPGASASHCCHPDGALMVPQGGASSASVLSCALGNKQSGGRRDSRLRLGAVAPARAPFPSGAASARASASAFMPLPRSRRRSAAVTVTRGCNERLLAQLSLGKRNPALATSYQSYTAI